MCAIVPLNKNRSLMDTAPAVQKITNLLDGLRQARLKIYKQESLLDAQISDMLADSEVIDFEAINLLIDRHQKTVSETVEQALNLQLSNDQVTQELSNG
jgi:hypothetical protein